MTDTIQSNETPLLQKMMENGQRLHPEDSLETIAIRTRKSVLNLPLEMRKVRGATIVVPEISPSLDQLVTQTSRSLAPQPPSLGE